MGRAWSSLVASLFALLTVTPLGAQGGVAAAAPSRFETWIDASGARITQPTRRQQDAGVFGVGAQRTTHSLLLAGLLSTTAARDSAGALQADLAAQYLLPQWPHLRTDVLLSAVSYGVPRSGHDWGSAAQLHEALDWNLNGGHRVGLDMLAARGNTSRLDDVSRRTKFSATALGAGAHASIGPFAAGVEWQRALSDDYALAEAAGYGLRRDAASFDYRDVTFTAGARSGRVDLQTVRARRRGGTATFGRSDATWTSVSVRATSAITLFGSAGTRLADVLRGIPQARVTSAGVRIQWGRVPVQVPAANHGGVLVVPESSGGATVTVRVRASATDRVDVATSHDEWTPIVMQRDGAGFIARISLPSGTHRIAVRVSDREWEAPPGTVRVRDDFGGWVGIVVVP